MSFGGATTASDSFGGYVRTPSGSESVNKFGAVQDVPSGAVATVWRGAGGGGAGGVGLDLYPFNDTVESLQISSDDASDTQDVVVEGAGTGNASVSETVTLNGTSAVSLSTGFLVVHRAYVDEAEITPTSGNLYLSLDGASLSGGVPSSDSDVRGVVTDSLGATQLAFYCVPDGFKAYITKAAMSVSGIGNISLFVRRTPGSIGRCVDNFLSVGHAEIDFQAVSQDYQTGFGPYDPGSVIEWRIESGQNGTDADVTFSVVLEKQ